MDYTTQMDAAKKGIITPEMEIICAKENIDVELLRERIAKGTVVIPANKNHRTLSPEAVGEGMGKSEYGCQNERRGDYGFKLLRKNSRIPSKAY